MLKIYQRTVRCGFTIMEMMLVIGIMAIIALIVIAAINPSKQLDDTRDTQRRVYIRELEMAMKQYSVEGGTILLGDGADLPTTPETAVGICKIGITCTGTGVDASALVTSVPSYIVDLPIDPNDPDNEQTGFCVYLESGDYYQVCNPRVDSTCGSTAADCP